MSVMHLSFRHYEMAYVKACSCIGRRIVDINFCGELCNMTQGAIREWFKQLYQMNVYSLHCEHDDELEGCIKTALNAMDAWDYNKMDVPVCDTYQGLKLFQCIRYQIEPDTMEGKDMPWVCKNVTMLNRVIREMKNRIIDTIPEYRDAKWAIE